MQIKLTNQHEEWLRAQVAAGQYASLDDAIAEAIDSLKAESDGMDWAKPLIAEGLAELDRGEVLSAEDVFSRLDSRLKEKL